MAMIDIIYTHPGEMRIPPGSDLRRTSVQEMCDYVNGLVSEMKFAGISVRFEAKIVEGRKSAVAVNGRDVEDILDGLEIKKPEVPPSPSSSMIIGFERAPDDWNRDYIEDIPDLLMKNAIAKAYADCEQNKVMRCSR